MLQAGKGIACTAIEAMKNPEIIEKAKAEHRERLDGEVYFSLIPEKHMPPKKADFVSIK